MNTGWLIFGLCALTLIGATLPLLHERRMSRKHDADKLATTNKSKAHHGIPSDRSGNQDQLH